MKNYNELTNDEQFVLRNKAVFEMTEEEKVQYCQFVTETYDCDDFCDYAIALEALSNKLYCYLDINKQYIRDDEKVQYANIAKLLSVLSDFCQDAYNM